MVPDFRWNKSKEGTERARSGWRQNTPRQNIADATPEHVGELLAEWGIVRPDRRQWLRLIEFRSGVALKHAADMAKPDE